MTPHFEAALTLCGSPHSVCGVCFSLNKSTFYLSLCLSLNSFCDEISRTWASLGPETCDLSWKTVSFGWVRVPGHGFKSQSVVNSFSFSSKEQVSFNFMATVTIFSDFGAQENKVCHSFHCFPVYFPWSGGTDAMILALWMLNFKSAFSLSSFHFHQEALQSSSLSGIRVVSSAHLRLLIFLLEI